MGIRNMIGAVAMAVGAMTMSPAMADLQFDRIQLDNGDVGVLVAGQFEMTDDLSGFEELVKRDRPVVVSFASPGGSIYKALELGRLIRKYGIQTYQPNDVVCASACAFAFMGGAGRHSDPFALGIHRSAVMPGYYADVNDAVAAIQQTTAEIMRYLMEMGVDTGVLELSLSTANGEMHFLSPGEMATFNVTYDVGHRKAVR